MQTHHIYNLLVFKLKNSSASSPHLLLKSLNSFDIEFPKLMYVYDEDDDTDADDGMMNDHQNLLLYWDFSLYIFTLGLTLSDLTVGLTGYCVTMMTTLDNFTGVSFHFFQRCYYDDMMEWFL